MAHGEAGSFYSWRAPTVSVGGLGPSTVARAERNLAEMTGKSRLPRESCGARASSLLPRHCSATHAQVSSEEREEKKRQVTPNSPNSKKVRRKIVFVSAAKNDLAQEMVINQGNQNGGIQEPAERGEGALYAIKKHTVVVSEKKEGGGYLQVNVCACVCVCVREVMQLNCGR